MVVLRDRAAVVGGHLNKRETGGGVRFSIIMPVLNEARGLGEVLQHLQAVREQGAELLLVDGGSSDASAVVAAAYCDQVLSATRGRAAQMNAGAAAASGDLLIFLHADTRLPVDALHSIVQGMGAVNAAWGRFDVRLSGPQWRLRVVEQMMNWRSRYSGMATGDQAIFVRREVFERIGGFPPLPLMEDLALSKRLRREGRPLCLRGPVITSSRRWEQQGILRTVLLMWRLRLAWLLGADAASLARRYH